jgi:phosphoribosylaminoimidazolecarboxamide formyltransferase/IMP cyclohydrolase
LAVYDKEGIVALARALRARDVQLVSSGGTAAMLRTGGIDVTEVADVTGFPEMLGGA